MIELLNSRLAVSAEDFREFPLAAEDHALCCAEQAEAGEQDSCEVGGRDGEPDACQAEEVRQHEQEDDDAREISRERAER